MFYSKQRKLLFIASTIGVKRFSKFESEKCWFEWIKCAFLGILLVRRIIQFFHVWNIKFLLNNLPGRQNELHKNNKWKLICRKNHFLNLTCLLLHFKYKFRKIIAIVQIFHCKVSFQFSILRINLLWNIDN